MRGHWWKAVALSALLLLVVWGCTAVSERPAPRLQVGDTFSYHVVDESAMSILAIETSKGKRLFPSCEASHDQTEYDAVLSVLTVEGGQAVIRYAVSNYTRVATTPNLNLSKTGPLPPFEFRVSIDLSTGQIETVDYRPDDTPGGIQEFAHLINDTFAPPLHADGDKNEWQYSQVVRGMTIPTNKTLVSVRATSTGAETKHGQQCTVLQISGGGPFTATYTPDRSTVTQNNGTTTISGAKYVNDLSGVLIESDVTRQTHLSDRILDTNGALKVGTELDLTYHTVVTSP